MNRHRAFLALGSNLGDRVAHLRGAVGALPDVTAVSNVYETPPVSDVEQGPYLNLVIRLDTTLDAHRLLEIAREREAAAGRVRETHWGPRTLDVDVLWVDGETVDESPELIVPHPRMFERSFVLVPLADVGADLLPDGYDAAAAAATDGIVDLGPLSGL